MADIQKLPGGGKIEFFTKNVIAALDSKAERALEKAVLMIENEVKNLMTNSPRGGRVYRVGKSPTKADKAAGRKFRGHKASAPGEPPAVNTGRLRNSITSKVVPKLGGGGFVGLVGTNVQYAEPLEKGVKGQPGPAAKKAGTARTGWRLAPRPAWSVAIKKLREKIIALFKGAGNG